MWMLLLCRVLVEDLHHRVQMAFYPELGKRCRSDDDSSSVLGADNETSEIHPSVIFEICSAAAADENSESASCDEPDRFPHPTQSHGAMLLNAHARHLLGWCLYRNGTRTSHPPL